MKLNFLKLPTFAFLLFGGIILNLVSCTVHPIVSEIKKLNADADFSCIDLKNLNQFILANQNERSFKKYVQNSIIDTLHLNKLLKKEIGQKEFDKLTCDFTSKNNHKAKHVHFYLENSGSMDGYVNGITEYESALSNLVVEAQHYYGEDNLSVNFINSEIIPAQINNINSFFKSLDPEKEPYNVGNKSVSELNELFKTVLAKTHKDDISIFISDCIYSLDKSRSTEQGLVFQQSLTKAVFLQKSKEFPLSAYVLQMNSSFSGKYYDKNNTVAILDKVQRPYYIWILGEETVLKDFLVKHNPSKYQGFRNSYYFTNNLNSKVRYELLKSTGLEGRISFNKQNNKIIDEIKLVDGKFQFAIAVDFKEYPDQKAFLNKESYKISPDFEIVRVDPIPQNNQPAIVNHNDWNKISNSEYTHIVTVRNIKQNFPSEFSIDFINSVPKWIDASSTEDDSDIKNNLDRTFGLKFLIQGIQSAYEYNGIKSPKIELTLNK